MWGAISGVSYGTASPEYSFPWSSYRTIREYLGIAPRSTPQTRTDVLWESGGAVGATAGGSGVMDPQVPNLPGVLPGPVVGWLPGVLDTIIDGNGVSTRTPPLERAREAEVVTDWGSVLGGIAETYIGARYAPQPTFQSFVDPSVVGPTPGLVIDSNGIRTGGGGGGVTSSELCGAGPCSSPRYLTYDCRTGTFSKKRRRRRGRLLTAGDQHDLGVIVAMFGKGAAGQIALAAAVKR